MLLSHMLDRSLDEGVEEAWEEATPSGPERACDTSTPAGQNCADEADRAATPESARLAAYAAEEMSTRSGDGWGRGSSSSAPRRVLSGCAAEVTAAAILSRFVPGRCARMACAQQATAWDHGRLENHKPLAVGGCSTPSPGGLSGSTLSVGH